MKTAVLLAFLAGIAACLVLGASLLWGLGFGLALFAGAACAKGAGARGTLVLIARGVRQVAGIIAIILLIGVLAGMWRASGTIPYLVWAGMRFVDASLFPLCAFLLCCAMSFLVGSSFGTAGTLGVVLMTAARAAGLDEAVCAGAILSGIYFGDRCSPVSSSAALCAGLTQTSVAENIGPMLRTGAVPFALACALYLCLSLRGSAGAGPACNGGADFLASAFVLSPWTLAPAAVLLAAMFCRLGVKAALAASILAAVPLAGLVQGMAWTEVLFCAVLGLPETRAGAAMAGGGLKGMLEVAGVIAVTGSYAGLFKTAGLLSEAEALLRRMASRIGAFTSAALAGLPLAALCCNQALPCILMHQLAGGLFPTRRQRMLALENSVVVLAPLIPWNIAGSVPRTLLGAGTGCLAFACYLYLVPLCSMAAEAWRRRRGEDGRA